MNQTVHFIITGGTIDSVFDSAKDMIVVNDHSVILDYINSKVRPRMKMTAEILTFKDSREITDNIREEMVVSIKKSPVSSIVITHGTYTMPDTAAYLDAALSSDNDKTVVLTGAMLPIKGFSESDAPYNLGYAVSAAQFLEPGVYLAMNSHVFRAGYVVKDIEKGVFVDKG